MLKTILYIVIGLILIIAILGMIAPKDFDVSRSIVINKPRAEVYEYMRSLKKQDEWSPWAKKDPNMKQTFTGTDGEVGAISAWEGNKDVGKGEQELMKLTPNERIDTRIRFKEPWESESDGYFILADQGSGTKVTWGFKGKNKFPFNIMMLFMNMDKAVGKDFDEGLNSLKGILEA